MRRWIPTSAVGLFLVGCGAPVDLGPVAVYDAQGTSGDPLFAEGQIRITDTCVTAVAQGQNVAVVFPSDEVSWDSETETLTYLGVPYQDGDFISLVYGGEGGRTENLSQDCPVGRYISVAPSS